MLVIELHPMLQAAMMQKKDNLFDENSSDDEAPVLTVDKEYARRFEVCAVVS